MEGILGPKIRAGGTGLIYRPFAEYARDKHGLQAHVITELGPARLISELDAGKLVIASVHPELRRPREDPPGTGGHLVLVTGHANGLVTFHNPSATSRKPLSPRSQCPSSIVSPPIAVSGVQPR